MQPSPIEGARCVVPLGRVHSGGSYGRPSKRAANGRRLSNEQGAAFHRHFSGGHGGHGLGRTRSRSVVENRIESNRIESSDGSSTATNSPAYGL
eukprot:1534723-Prymnesium_polylepis.2